MNERVQKLYKFVLDDDRVQKLYKFVLDDDSELILNDKQIDELYADFESIIKQRAAIRFVINTKE